MKEIREEQASGASPRAGRAPQSRHFLNEESGKDGGERMKKLVEWLRGAWWAVRCLVFDLGWLCWGAWWASREEMRDERGYADGTR